MEVVAGNGPPPILVSELVRGLPDDSMTHALKQGGMQFLGWGTDRHMAASTYDAINNNTVASGNWGKKPPTLPSYPRPSVKTLEKPKATVAALFDKLTAKLGR